MGTENPYLEIYSNKFTNKKSVHYSEQCLSVHSFPIQYTPLSRIVPSARQYTILTSAVVYEQIVYAHLSNQKCTRILQTLAHTIHKCALRPHNSKTFATLGYTGPAYGIVFIGSVYSTRPFRPSPSHRPTALANICTINSSIQAKLHTYSAVRREKGYFFHF